MPTTSQLLGLTPSQRAAAVFTAAGEAGPGNDALGVLQTILIRKVKSNKNIADLVKEPQQFVANDPYSLSQVADSRYGQKVYGARYKQIERMFENPDLMADALRKAKGAEEFRGQTLLKNKLPSDFMFDPKGNFYFNLNPKLANTLAEKLSRLSPQSAVPDQSGQQSSVQQTTPFKVKPFDFEKELNKKLTENLISSANKIDSSNDYLRASSLLNLASDLEDSSDPLDQEAANIYKSKAMEVMFKSTPLTDPIDLINTYINVAKDQEEYTQKASNLEKLVNDVRQSLAQNVGKNIENASEPTQNIKPASNPTQKIAYKDVTITNPNDTGGLGFDFVFEGGGRGARFASPFSAEVLKVTKDPREFRLEEGATTRGYGNNVELRFKTPQGKAVDVLIAHFDDLNPNLKPGQLIKPGEFLGTQGRTGSTTGPHVSMDFFNPGSNSADSEVIKIKNLIRDRIAKGLPVFG
jgi:murein DD-endopeptidase MepM/ murein hydrolase activator NlpD